LQWKTGAQAAAASAMMMLAISAFAPLPALALTPGELLQKIIPRGDQPQPHKRSRMKAAPKQVPAPAKPPLPASKPDTGTAPTPAETPDKETKPTTPPVPPLPEPSPVPEPETAPPPPAQDQKPSPEIEPAPLPEPSPQAKPAAPAAEPPASAVTVEPTIAPTPPLGEPMPPAGTVIAPADALGTVIPPVQPSILPSAVPLPVAPPATEPAAPLPEEKPEATDQGPPRPQPNVEELAACRAGLASLAVAAEAEPPLVEGECGAPDPFKVTGFQANAVTLDPAATIDCAATTALTHWVLEDVQPAAKAAFGAPVTKIAVAGSYTCRGRNNVPGARLSEHAFMNAIDISGFTIAGRMITVTETDGQSAEDAAFIAAVRKAACARFTTVLGPGSDPEHATHLHLDVLKRGRNGDYRICE